jgi:hypothetical protein
MRAALAPACLLLALVATSAGCQSGLTDEAPLSGTLDKAYFDCKVQPVLTKSCSALACHGDPARYYRVYARNRLRLGLPESKRPSFLTAEERAFNYDMARAYVVPGAPGESFLLQKALAQEKGGYYHGGEALFKRGNVFWDKTEKDYQALEAWVNGAKEDPACIEPGSDQ